MLSPDIIPKDEETFGGAKCFEDEDALAGGTATTDDVVASHWLGRLSLFSNAAEDDEVDSEEPGIIPVLPYIIEFSSSLMRNERKQIFPIDQ